MKNKITLCICIICFNVSIKAQWVAQTSGTTDNLWSVFFPSVNVGYVSANGYLLKTTNGGSNWNSIPDSSTYSGAPLYFTSVDTGYSCGLGGVLKTVDGGMTWVDNFPYTNIANCIIHFPTTNIGYAVTQNASIDSVFIYKTINAGASWTLKSSLSLSYQPTSVFFSDAMNGSMILAGLGIYKTTDGGVTWTPTLTTFSAEYLLALHFPAANIGYAVGGDSIFKTTDEGATWNPIYFPNSFVYTTVFFTNIDTGYAAGGDGFSTGVIRKTVDGGLSWTLSFSDTYTFQSIHFPNPSTGYACGQNGIIYKLSSGTGIHDLTDNTNLNVYPNPTSGMFSVTFNTSISKIEILNVLGEKIYSVELPHSNVVNQKTDLDLSGQAKGIYFVKAENEKGVVMKKVIYQ